MFVRKLDDLIGTDKEIKLTDGRSELQSVRILTLMESPPKLRSRRDSSEQKKFRIALARR